MRHCVETRSARIDEDYWTYEHDYIINHTIPILKFSDSIHKFIFNFI